MALPPPVETEPDFSYLDALAPYQPLAMKCVYCPIDTRLNFHQVSKLLKEVQVGWLPPSLLLLGSMLRLGPKPRPHTCLWFLSWVDHM